MVYRFQQFTQQYLHDQVFVTQVRFYPERDTILVSDAQQCRSGSQNVLRYFNDQIESCQSLTRTRIEPMNVFPGPQYFVGQTKLPEHLSRLRTPISENELLQKWWARTPTRYLLMVFAPDVRTPKITFCEVRKTLKVFSELLKRVMKFTKRMLKHF